MKSFREYVEIKSIQEAEAPKPPVGGAPPAGAPPGAPPGGPGAPPGGISSPMPGGLGGGPPPSLGGGGGPPIGDPTAGMGGATPDPSKTGAMKLKAYNVWDVLEKILG